MNQTTTLIILMINFFVCTSQVKTTMSNFDKLTLINKQIKNNSTTEKTYKSLDSLKNVIDGADAEFYLEIYKDAIINDTKTLKSFLNLYNKEIDKDVIIFFEQDEKTSSIIKQKLNSSKKNTNSEPVSLNGYWKQDCNESLAFVSISNDKAVICVNTNQIYIEAKMERLSQNHYNLRYLKTIDLGTGGMKLEWNYFSKNIVIAELDSKNTKEINLKWFGFFNLKTRKRNWVEESDFYLEKNISLRLEKCYDRYVINDIDGYTNLRKEKNSSSEILQKIGNGEEIEVLDNSENWWLVKTALGKKGYVYKNRIKVD